MDSKTVLAFVAFFCGFECSKILVIYPTISHSHVIPLQSLSMALAEKGHEITFFSPFPLSQKMKNYRDFKVPFDEADKSYLNQIMTDKNIIGMFGLFPKMLSLFFRTSNTTLQMKEMRKLMNEESFDLLIVGYAFSEGMLGIADHFKCPSILFSPFGSMAILNQAVGNPLGVVGTHHMMLPVGKMNFVNRLKNFLIVAMELAFTPYLKDRSRQFYKYIKRKTLEIFYLL